MLLQGKRKEYKPSQNFPDTGKGIDSCPLDGFALNVVENMRTGHDTGGVLTL